MSSGVLLKEWNPSTRPFALAQVSCHTKKKKKNQVNHTSARRISDRGDEIMIY